MGTFLFCGVPWRFTLLPALEETSADCFRKCMRLCVYFTSLAYVCVRLLRTYMAFAHVVQLLRTYTAYFCASCTAFAYIYGFCARWADLCTYTAYLLWCSMRTVSRDPILRVPQFLFSVWTLVIRGQSQGSFFEDSVDFFVRTSCSLLLDSLEDLILRDPPSSLYAWADRDSLSDHNSEVSCWYW